MKAVLLGDVAQIISGQSPQSINYNQKGEGLPLYQGKKDFGAMFTADPTVWTTQATKVAEKGDVLISVRAPVGPVNFASQKMNIGRGLAAIRPWEGLDAKYLYLFMKLNEPEIAKLGGGATFDSINRNHLKNLEIPYPDIEEQRRIVKKLDKAFEKIDKAIGLTQKNLQNSQDFFQSSLEKMFTEFGQNSSRHPLGDIISEKLIGLVRSKNLQKVDAKYPYLKMDSIGNDFRFLNKTLSRVNATPMEAERYKLLDGDFLFNTRNSRELVGKFCLYDGHTMNDADITLFNNNILRLRFNKSVTSKFIYYAFISGKVQTQLNKLISGATNVAAIYFNDLKKVEIAVPDKTKQDIICKKLDMVDKETQQLQKLYQQKLDNLQELKKSLLDKAFKGNL